MRADGSGSCCYFSPRIGVAGRCFPRSHDGFHGGSHGDSERALSLADPSARAAGYLAVSAYRRQPSCPRDGAFVLPIIFVFKSTFFFVQQSCYCPVIL
jgi:hypothetical protein